MAAILVAGTSSGVGKTTVSLGLIRCLANRGYRVQPFKVGPDFLDPLHLSAAAGIPCYNLDSWMTSPDYVRSIFSQLSSKADISVIEGVMGMFDGFTPVGLAGSSAEIASILDVPVILVVDAHGIAGSLAPLVYGFSHFSSSLTIAGVIANNCGSDTHASMLRQALDAASLPPLLGALPQDALPRISERHLGLLPPDEDPRTLTDLIAPVLERNVNIDLLLELSRRAGKKPATEIRRVERHRTALADPPRIAVARDNAFFFYYPDNLKILEDHGAVLVPFSPLCDRRLPDGVSALYIGGGYPEAYASELAKNKTMMDAVRDHAASGAPVYAECGGFMYLGETFVDLDGNETPMAGVIPVQTAMSDRFKALGYREARILYDQKPTDAGASFRGHEFHYSFEIVKPGAGKGWSPAFAVSNRKGEAVMRGYRKGNVRASYLHLHFGSNPDAALTLFFQELQPHSSLQSI